MEEDGVCFFKLCGEGVWVEGFFSGESEGDIIFSESEREPFGGGFAFPGFLGGAVGKDATKTGGGHFGEGDESKEVFVHLVGS